MDLLPKSTICKIFYVLIGEEKYDAFKENEVIPYLKETWVDTEKSKKEFSVVNICMDFIDYKGDTLKVSEYLYFKIVENKSK